MLASFTQFFPYLSNALNVFVYIWMIRDFRKFIRHPFSHGRVRDEYEENRREQLQLEIGSIEAEINNAQQNN